MEDIVHKEARAEHTFTWVVSDMAKVDVALQYFDDIKDGNGDIPEYEVKRILTKLGFSFDEKIHLQYVLDKMGIHIKTYSGTIVRIIERDPNEEDRKSINISYKNKPRKKKDACPPKTKNDRIIKPSQQFAQKNNDYFDKNYPLIKERGENSNWIKCYLPNEEQSTTITPDIPRNKNHIDPYYYRMSERPEKVQHDKKMMEVFNDYPCLDGLIGDQICFFHQSDSTKQYSWDEVYFMPEKDRLRVKESLVYDVFLTAYRESKKNNYEFEELLSDLWLEMCGSIDRYINHSSVTVNKYVDLRLNRRINKYKTESSADSNKNEIYIGLYEDMCLDENIAQAYTLRKMNDFEIFLFEIEHIIENASLNDREKLIIAEYFGFNGNPKSFEEIGADLNLTRSRIQQIYRIAIQKLQNRIKRIVKPWKQE